MPLASTIGVEKDDGVVPNGVTEQAVALRTTTSRFEASTLLGSLNTVGATVMEIGVYPVFFRVIRPETVERPGSSLLLSMPGMA